MSETQGPAPDEIIEYRARASLDNAQLNALFSTGWPSWQTAPDTSDWTGVLSHSLTWIAAFASEHLVGFVNVAWDGRDHAFLLDPRVLPEYRRRGIGRQLVRMAAAAARDAGCEWLHVDFAAELAPFYTACGFTSTAAGVQDLKAE
jgi:ribosomal protein S18 acetylase RimI-like enzyme